MLRFSVLLMFVLCVKFSDSANFFRSYAAQNSIMNPNILDSVAIGVQMAMDECKSIFKWDRWNCPQSAFSRKQHHLSTKEKAYTDAILAAGIIYSITRNCSRGELIGCNCDPHTSQTHMMQELMIHEANKQTTMQPVKDWTWGGCSDDTRFGEDVVLDYLKDDLRNSDPQGFANRHNNKVGTEIVRKTMKKTCKCHGVSGSCSLQTCWMQMVPFSQIARQLRDKYNRAIQISFQDVDGTVPVGNTARHLPLMEMVKRLPDNLVYLADSPNFCVASNSSGGWAGTKGRRCSRANLETASLEEKKSCRNLCRSCGYKVKRQKRTVTHRCDCVFNWCYSQPAIFQLLFLKTPNLIILLFA